MVESGAAVDVWDAAMIRDHQRKLVRIEGQKEQQEAQQKFINERRKRLADRAAAKAKGDA